MTVHQRTYTDSYMYCSMYDMRAIHGGPQMDIHGGPQMDIHGGPQMDTYIESENRRVHSSPLWSLTGVCVREVLLANNCSNNVRELFG